MEYTKVKVPGNLVILNWEARKRIKEAFEEFFVEIDMSDSEIIDSAGIELLARLRNHIRSKNGLVKITNINPLVRETLNVCGLANTMELA